MPNYDDIFNAPIEKQQEHNDKRNRNDSAKWAAQQKERRTAAYELADKMTTEVCADGDKFRAYLDLQSQFNRYSATNGLLIMAQYPHATQLHEKSYWTEHNISIKEGEEPITILEPGKSFQREDGTRGTYYNAKSVYDVSQTDAVPEAEVPTYPEDRQLLAALITKRPVPIETSDNIPNGAFYDHEQKKIFVRRGMEAHDIFRSVSLAIARAEIAQKTGDIGENAAFKSYCVSYMLGRKYGIEVDGYDFKELPESLRNSEPKDARMVLTEIRDTMNAMALRMYRALEPKEHNKEQER